MSGLSVVADVTAPLATILDQVKEFVGRYCYMPEGDLDIATVWAAHTYAFEQFDHTPYLFIWAKGPDCGKSRLLKVLSVLVYQPKLWVSVSDATAYRAVEQFKPTMLIDEIDTVYGGNKEREALRAVINGGYEKGYKVPRQEGSDGRYVTVEYDPYCPKAFAGISQCLPPTVASRSVAIELTRQPTKLVKDFYLDDAIREAEPLRDGLAQLQTMALRRDVIRGEINRDADKWRPMLSVADAAGGDWPDAMRRAMIARGIPADSMRLLRDMQLALDDYGERYIFSTEIIARTGWDVNETTLRTMLLPFGVKSRGVRVGPVGGKAGYAMADLRKLWRRHLGIQA